MGLIPNDFPERLAERGVDVNVLGGWETNGGSADHDAIALHHTASSSGESPSSCANYCFYGADDAPHYNVLVDRDGVAWVGAREKSNNAGKISSVARDEALRGEAGTVSACERGLGDDCSDNESLFGLSCQNNGVGEHWSEAMVDTAAIVAAVVLECLGIPDEGRVTEHRVLTARKIDNCGDSCPYDWRPLVADALAGRGGPITEPEVDEMFVLNAEVPVDEGATVALPAGFKSARVDLWVEGEGANLWAAQEYEGGAGAVGLWAGGHVWELWLPPSYRTNTSADVAGNTAAVRVENRGPGGPVLVTVSGT